MMTEIWWKVFLAAIITAIAAKLFGCKWNIVLLFAVSSIGWLTVLILLIVVSQWLHDFWKKLKRRP